MITSADWKQFAFLIGKLFLFADSEIPAAPKMRNGIKWKLTVLK